METEDINLEEEIIKLNNQIEEIGNVKIWQLKKKEEKKALIEKLEEIKKIQNIKKVKQVVYERLLGELDKITSLKDYEGNELPNVEEIKASFKENLEKFVACNYYRYSFYHSEDANTIVDIYFALVGDNIEIVNKTYDKGIAASSHNHITSLSEMLVYHNLNYKKEEVEKVF